MWDAPYVFGLVGGTVPVYTPDPFQAGSSVSHWDTSLFPDQLMEPFYTGPNHDPGLLLPALVDMGWRLAGTALIPAAPTAEAEPTATPTRRPTAVPPVIGAGQTLFVTNFDSATVSVIDVPPAHVSKTIPVGDGPIGITATADGGTVFVANFHSATVSVISATERRVIDTIPVQGSANSVALSPDESLLYVTDTFTETVSVVDTATHRVVHVIPVHPQPAGVAVVPDGRAFVTDFGSNTLSVVDGGLGEAVALLTLDPFVDAGGPISIAVDPGQGVLWVTAAIDYQVVKVDISGLARGGQFPVGPAEAIQLAPDGNTAYLAGRFGDGVVKEVDLTSGELRRTIKIGGAPEALAMTPDGARVYVADAGSNLVSFFNTSGIYVLGQASGRRRPDGHRSHSGGAHLDAEPGHHPDGDTEPNAAGVLCRRLRRRRHGLGRRARPRGEHRPRHQQRGDLPRLRRRRRQNGRHRRAGAGDGECAVGMRLAGGDVRSQMRAGRATASSVVSQKSL